jgi:hypothetical protein
VVPFVPFAVQEQAMRTLYEQIMSGRDTLIEKSRDMGATWTVLLVGLWMFLFMPKSAGLCASRVEDDVDKRGSPDSLFWKVEHALRALPKWMQPDGWQRERRNLHFGNPANGAVIDGSSTNADLARGGRRTWMLFDEFASVADGEAIYATTSDVSPARIFLSTPKGMGSFDAKGSLRGNAFGAIRFSNRVQIVTLHWREHPTKGAGAEVRQDPATGKSYWWSPWYQEQIDRRASRRDIAENLDIDYLGSGDMFFDSDVLRMLRTSGAISQPCLRGELDFDVKTNAQGASYRIENIKFRQDERGRLSLWVPLYETEQGLRPDPRCNYASGWDIGLGTGASNSVGRVACVDTRQEIAAFVCPHTPPEQLARYAVALSMFCAGQSGGCYTGWEANGPGEIFGREVHRLGYHRVLGNQDTRIPWNPTDQKIGWYSDRSKKRIAFGSLRAALARREFIPHDEALVGELEQQVYYMDGGVGPAELVEEVQGAREAHGDRCVAAAVLLISMQEQPKATRDAEPLPPTSMAAMRKAREREQARRIAAW